MRARSSGILLAAGAMCAAVLIGKQERKDTVQVMPSVDLPRYMGTWYEIARLPAWFQRNCSSNTTAGYSLRPDGRVTVLNQCRMKDGSLKSAQGIARIANKKGPNSKLKVRFFGPFQGDYWILDLDPEYRWAVVGDPHRRYLWVLSRQPQLSAEIFAAIVERAAGQGYDVTRLIMTKQV